MAMPEFIYYQGISAGSADSLTSPALAGKSKLGARTISIATGKPKPVRNSKNVSKQPVSCAWYEAEDRNKPSVSSF